MIIQNQNTKEFKYPGTHNWTKLNETDFYFNLVFSWDQSAIVRISEVEAALTEWAVKIVVSMPASFKETLIHLTRVAGVTGLCGWM